MLRRLVSFVVILSVVGLMSLSVVRAGNCSNASLTSNPGPGTVTAGTPIQLTGSASCNPGPGALKMVIFNGIIASSNGQGQLNATWNAQAQYGSAVTVHFYAYASDDAAGYFPAQADLNFTVVAAGQAQPPQNNPPPANTGGGGQQAPQQPAQDIPFVGSQNKPGGNSVQAQSEPTYIYQNPDTNSRIVAQVHAGWYVGLNATSPGWTQVTFNFGVGYMVDGNGQSSRVGPDPIIVPKPDNQNNPYAVGRLGDGGLEVERICQVTGQHATNDGQHAYSWGCNGQILDKNATCAKVWPEYPYARVVGGLAGWSCHPSPQEQESPSNAPPANSGGSSGGTTNTGGGNSGTGNSSGGSAPLTCSLPTRLVSGQEGHVISSVLNLRKGAGTNFGIWITLHQGDYFSVTGSPTCFQGYNWWPASFLGYNGYIAEGANGAYYAEPSKTPSPPAQPDVTLPSRTLIAVCPLNNIIYEYYKNPVSAVFSAVDPKATSAFFDLVKNSLTVLGLGVNATDQLLSPNAEIVTMYVYQRKSDGIFYYQMERSMKSGQKLQTEFSYSVPLFQDFALAHCSYVNPSYGSVVG